MQQAGLQPHLPALFCIVCVHHMSYANSQKVNKYIKTENCYSNNYLPCPTLNYRHQNTEKRSIKFSLVKKLLFTHPYS